MKYLRAQYNDRVIVGALNEEDIITIVAGDLYTSPTFTDEQIPLSAVTLLPPTTPTKIVCIGLNYKQHADEMGKSIPDEPVMFLKPTSALLAAGKQIIIPEESARVDFEAELALVVRRTAKNVAIDRATDYIFGYTCLNDVTARDLQTKDGQWTRAKSFDTFAPVGPVIQTDGDPNSRMVKAYVNDQERQSGNTSDFIFNAESILAFVSRVMTLYPGDLIATGTPAGVGQIKAGDEVSIFVEGVGMLTNTVS